jgi:hypothetical protein
MIIEQDAKLFREAVTLHSKADVRFFRLAQAKLWSLPHATPSGDTKLSFDVTFKPAGKALESDALTLDTDFAFTVVEEAQERRPLISIECRFEAQYGLAEGYTPSEQQIEAFHAANAIFNCWPFFREYVQNSVLRMNFPPPPVPFLKISVKQETPKKSRITTKAIPSPD